MDMENRVDGLGFEVTREVSTEVLYRKRLLTLKRRARKAIGREATLFEIVDCFCSADGEFAPATIRNYAAALSFAIDYFEGYRRITVEVAQACRRRLADRPIPRPKNAEKRTSAKKAKSVPTQVLSLVCSKLRRRGRKDDRLLVRLLVQNVTFGLRPCEYHGAKVEEFYLVVPCAKATNGRSLGETRELGLAGLPVEQVQNLKTLIAEIEVAAKGDVAALIDRLGGRLRRACMSLQVPVFSLYTTRHQAIANKKSTSSDEQVAAFAGHVSIYTAQKHYAPKGKAWKVDNTAKPSPQMVQRVRERKVADAGYGPRF
ncbi:hypothetical protein JHL21_06285 [Devosia sp. WQ 349]|uniref:hypothetical protein n=1 Tax=Devosia sp. WQ 349K1 TaxID=2800329 RepID=UPI001903BE28|nr:hypothetical protein [Devosia sp. WQ 349K1]MBK1794105.1 hypothetical protein [Devosia sp. WQ 349K1]